MPNPNAKDHAEKSVELNPQPGNVFFRCVEDSSEAVMITDREGRIQYTNPAWRQLYGYSVADTVGQTARLLHSGVHSPAFYREMWAAIENPSQGNWRGEVVNKTKDGRLRTIFLMITPYRASNGQILGYMGIGTDITREKELEKRLRVQEGWNAVRVLSEGLGHEIGTILNVIRGRAEILLRRPADADAVARGAETIVTQSDRISRLVAYLLRFSRERAHYDPENIVLLEKARKALEEFRERPESRGVAVDLQIAPDLIVVGDRRRLLGALSHLLENAFEAIEAKRQDFCGEADHRICLRARRQGERICLEVEDTGCGIPPENITKIFQPFFTTKDIGQGTGMGLTLAARSVEEMGGEISVETLPFGTLFRLLLPAAA